MDWPKLAENMPTITTRLCEMMVKEGIGSMLEMGFADIAFPAVSIGFRAPDGTEFKVTLSIDEADDEDRDGT